MNKKDQPQRSRKRQIVFGLAQEIMNKKIQILFLIELVYNSLIKTMEQRVKKKYIEKTAPDKQDQPYNNKNDKPKYVAKESTKEEKPYREDKPYRQTKKYREQKRYREDKPYREQNRRQQNQFKQQPYPFNTQNQQTQKPKQQNSQPQRPKYTTKTTQEKKASHYNQKSGKRQYYQKPSLRQKQSSHHDEQSCVICSQPVHKRDYIWTCSCCYISMHLKCIKTWILNVNKDKNKNEVIFTWTCPQCKFEYNDTMPKYYCYCGKFKDPEYDRDLEPHSCGQICGRKRGTYCTHPCPQRCHKGKCKPCEHQGTLVTCQCGKSSRVVKCSEERQVFQCGKKCERILNCCKHKCERNCHHGACLPCKKKHMVKCWCGKNDDVVDCVQAAYSCEEICGKKLNCGFHTCQDLCHEGNCKDCQKTPELQKTCPCGAYTIEMLTGDEFFRQKCEDPIPTCGMPCKKLLSCGHKCSKSCHEGNCSQCKIIVNQNCLCGLTSRKIECYRAHSHKQILKCDNVCKRKRNCGQHNCNTECCPHRNSNKPEDHTCELTCQRMLNCGKHNCGQNCHMGLCKKCPVIYSQPQPCPCGKTSLRPPIICGTVVPQCENICQKVMDCGHKCLKVCHYGSCKCFEETKVKCRCGKEEISTICGRETLCLNKCTKLLQCGHKCLIQCHKQSCEQAHKHHPCRKVCEKIRPDCGHSCGQHCHPSKKCTQFPCQAQIFIKCECGHRQTSILCGMTQDYRHKKEIKCNSKCENLKRFDVLYKGKETYYPTSMVHFALKNISYVQGIQARLAKFILQSQDPVAEIQHKFGDSQTKLILLNLFENHYHLNAHFYRHKKFASFTLLQTENTMIPKPLLSEYVTKITKGEIKRANLPFEFTVSFQVEQKQKADIVLRTLKPYLHKYYLERKEKSVQIHFWSQEDGVRVLNALQSENQHVEFHGEEHVADQDIEIIADTDIIETELTPEEIEANTKANEEKSRKMSQQKFEQSLTQKPSQEKTQMPQQPLQQPQKLIIMKSIPPPPQQPPKKKTGAPKIIIKKSNLIFQPKEYPDSKQNVQDIYLIDQDEMYSQQVDWDKLVTELCGKNIGPEATEWRIRSLIMISSFNNVPEAIFREQFEKLLKMYAKDKERARRILQIQKLDTKTVKQQMSNDGIYLSDHQPQMLAYLMLFNYFSVDKIDFELQDHHLNSMQVTQAQEILHAIEYQNFEEFYTIVKSAHYVLSCALIPFVHTARQLTIDILEKAEKLPVQNLFKYLFFGSEQELLQYWKQSGIEVGVKFSKTLKEDAYYLKQGEATKEKVKDSRFIEQVVKSKRDKKYFLVEPEQLIDDQYMTRSFFAFGDFKESISNKYMVSLIKSLRN